MASQGTWEAPSYAKDMTTRLSSDWDERHWTVNRFGWYESRNQNDMATDAPDKKLTALLRRLRQLANQITQRRAESAETRKLVEEVQRRIARARDALRQPELVQMPANRPS
jgi:uncharacterized membrane protein YccC